MSSSSNYSVFDRLLHRFAFCHPIVQKVLGDLESDIFRRKLKSVESSQEVFITGLPRAGTTLLLELLYGTNEFGSYTYRNMPFILAPLLWSSVSRPYQRVGSMKERAHGDGVSVSFDSPEAFDEVVWLAHLADKIVGADSLATLSAGDITEDLSVGLRSAASKILLQGAENNEMPTGLRYLSKNNAYISRLEALQTIFPTSTTLVIFRHPLAHISSLAKQHARFSEMHATDRFSQQYMKWIGHFEFGENFKPMNFGGWLGNGKVTKTVDDMFWIEYWNSAYAYALDHAGPAVRFFDYDQLLADPGGSLARLADSLGLRDGAALTIAADKIRSPASQPADEARLPPEDWARAQGLYDRLQKIAL